MGFGVVCIFLVSWAAAIVVYRLKDFEKAIPALGPRN